MATPAAFSRLQLAAALIEYDNDPERPDPSDRSAKESAIFAHFRRNPAERPGGRSRQSDYLGVALPSETGSVAGRDSAMGRRSRNSRGSLDALRNPFGVDTQSEMDLNEEDEEEEEREELEVDLQSWGLDAFMPKDKVKSAKAKGKEPASSNSRPRMPSTSFESSAATPHRVVVTAQSTSLDEHLEYENATMVDRRRSFASPLELADAGEYDRPGPHRRAVSQADLLSQGRSQTLPEMVPFPTGSIRAPSTGPDQAGNIHSRTYSTASMNSKYLLDGDTGGRRRTRSSSVGTMDMLKSADDNPFAIERPSSTSRFDPKAALADRPRSRAYSSASMGSRMMLENDGMSVMTGDPYPRERPYSTMELLRPKILVMPSPLQPISINVDSQPVHRTKEGFELSIDGPPLPPGARSSRRLSTLSLLSATENIPVASNSFTPNPLPDLSLSQKMFRNTLIAGGSTSNLGSDLPRATQDGEQVEFDPSAKEDVPATRTEELPQNTGRPAGKLYGKSLIDDLEARKANMRSKQRVFKGDERPSMMARNQTRSSTLIDPATLLERPASQRMSSYGSQGVQEAGRRGSLAVKPLLTFDSTDNLSPVMARPAAARSVFGVDTLWEREMDKLKAIQAKEATEEDERRKRETEAERIRQDKKNKRKKKGKGTPDVEEPAVTKVDNIAAEAPTLPDIQRATVRRQIPKPSDSDVESDSDDDDNPVPKASKVESSWHVGSSDEEEDGPRRTTGVGLRYPNRGRGMSQPAADSDSEEDLPLAATIHKAAARSAFSGTAGYQVDSDEEDKPLAQVLHKVRTSPTKSNSLNPRRQNSREDDDEPLGLRASRMPSVFNAGDDDEMPLAFHPDQQRRTQYQMLAQQQQQQQMMMHAQMQNNMLMSAHASMMGSFYGPPPMMNPMPMMPMQVPIPIPSPPPMVDEANFGRVDRWRRDIVVDRKT